MTTLGVSFEGMPHFPLKRLPNGYVVPELSVAEIIDRHRAGLREGVELAVAAESLGYEYVVHSEHHANLLSTVSPNPILTQTAIASQTDEIRLLQMANILPWHEPVRLAEQLSMLDVLSDGRVDVGIGWGGTDPAAETLGQYWGGTPVDETKNQLSFEEKYELLLEAWTSDLVTHRGQFHQVPPAYTGHEKRQEYFYFADDVCEYSPEDYLNIVRETPTLEALPILPRPEQQPHPQLWKPALSAHSAAWAARRGMNVCTHVFDIERTGELVDTYYEAAEAADWPDRREAVAGGPFRRGWDERSNRGIGVIVPVFNTAVADEATVDRWKLGIEYVRSRKEGAHEVVDGRLEIDVDAFVEESDVPVVGDSEAILAQLESFVETCGFEDACFILDPNTIGLTFEERRTQLEALARDVRPGLEDVLSASVR
ncbi:LLM class flavin-dependent oxidoreductase [Natronobiforma cellulositropha]|uniref:LLM class flavin-dependent oxidoreductase n=1 Tax=Natronobiforma cellulositropha TaxID=1679076 RepID=UPI0021D5D1AD|nr:LLM class flavin-dependent oxidoreductase [Natronobiforma cellulositropha]